MFPALLSNVRQKLDTVRRTIETNDALRALLSQPDDLALTRLRGITPSLTEWRVYDHCAALTRLYAIYEVFVDELITDLLALLPSLYPYAELSTALRREHREGIGQLLQRLESYRHRSLSAEQIVRDFHEAIAGIRREYVILPQTILRYDQNLRMNVLDLLLSRIGIDHLHQWLSNHRQTRAFIANTRGGQNTIEAELASLIDYRNDAAHRNVTDVLGKESLLELCSFIEALCHAIYERINHWVLSRRLDRDEALELGRVTEKFRDRIVVAKLQNAVLTVGDAPFFMSSTHCYRAAILSIQVNDVPQQSITVGGETEIGLQTDVEVSKNDLIIVG